MNALSFSKCLLAGIVLIASCTPGSKQEGELNKLESEVWIQNPVIPGYYSAASIVEYENTFYVYATINPWDYNELAVWETRDFKHWTLRGINWPTRDQCISPTGKNNLISSPEVVRGTDGKFYMYVNSGSELWMGSSDSPLGPWYNGVPEGQPMIRNLPDSTLTNTNASCFIDTDGKVYLYWTVQRNWSESKCMVVPLKNNMYEFDGEPADITPANFFEAPDVFKHRNTYYMLYTEGKINKPEHKIRYAKASLPLGPWTEADNSPLLKTTDEALKNPGHPEVFKIRDQHYMLYHRAYNTEFPNLLMQLCIDSLIVNNDQIQTINTSSPGFRFQHNETHSWIDYQVIEVSSSYSEQHTPTAIHDNLPGTFWRSASDDMEPFVLVDMGELNDISTTNLWLINPYGVNRFQIEYSRDNINWDMFYAGRHQVYLSSPYSNSKLVKARYLKIRFFYTPNYTNVPAIAEFKIE